MLSLAALDSGIEITIALRKNQIHVVYHLLRSIQEALDLATFFSLRDKQSSDMLNTWYSGKIVSHGDYRSHLKKMGNNDKADHLNEIYKTLSKFNHNSYPTLLYSYGLDSGGFINHYGRYDSGITIPTNSIAMLHAISSKVILELSFQLLILKILDSGVLKEFIGDQKRKRPINRRFQIKNSRSS
jgi:hypothetical protein